MLHVLTPCFVAFTMRPFSLDTNDAHTASCRVKSPWDVPADGMLGGCCKRELWEGFNENCKKERKKTKKRPSFSLPHLVTV